jgi:hypothetical protein
MSTTLGFLAWAKKQIAPVNSKTWICIKTKPGISTEIPGLVKKLYSGSISLIIDVRF